MSASRAPRSRFARGSGQRDPLDAKLGALIRERRLERGLSQGALATSVGVSFQQMQKYESGANRIAVSTLVKICQGLKIPPGPLVDELAGARSDEAEPRLIPLDAGRAARDLDAIQSDEIRQAIFALAKTIASTGA